MKARAPADDSLLGPYAAQLARNPVWTAAEEREAGARLVAARKSGNAGAVKREADAFVRANLRLVVLVAHKFRGYEVPLSDLVQEGNLGLIRAVETFQPELGFKFSTYAVNWIRHFCRRCCDDHGQVVRVPVGLREKARKVRKYAARFRSIEGREPDADELADLTGEPISTLSRVADAAKLGTVLSLDTPVGEDDGAMLGDRQPSDVADPESALLERERQQEARQMIRRLDKRTAGVLRARFRDEWTLEAIGMGLGVSRQRAAQIEAKALRRLRNLAGRKESADSG
ncbi:MAG: sigma-70 family RNA polymerase sigma factor [Polyangiaceae bacterium]|jgi:RNA polymerase primary sigma factor